MKYLVPPNLCLRLDHEITLQILEFVLSSIEKVKPGFLLFSMCIFSEQTGQDPNLTAFTSRIQVFWRPEWAKRGTPWKWNLTIFKWKNEFPKQLGLEKQMKKMGSFVWFSCLLPELWSLNCQKLCPFWIFLLMSATNIRLL